MKCPECVADGMTSKVFGGDVWISTAMAAHSFWDEGGVRHTHDRNTSSTQLTCSNGHSWVHTRTHPCAVPGCGWS